MPLPAGAGRDIDGKQCVEVLRGHCVERLESAKASIEENTIVMRTQRLYVLGLLQSGSRIACIIEQVGCAAAKQAGRVLSRWKSCGIRSPRCAHLR